MIELARASYLKAEVRSLNSWTFGNSLAVMTDGGFFKMFARIADHFVQAKIKQFDFNETDFEVRRTLEGDR